MKFEDFESSSYYEPKSTKNEVHIYEKQVNKQQSQVKTFSDNKDLAALQLNLGYCLEIIDDEVMKGYITNLSSMPIIEPDNDIFDKLKDVQFFKITELVYEQNEFSVHKLATIFHTLSNNPCTLIMMIQSDEKSNNFYLGVRSRDNLSSTGTMLQMLKQSLLGQFPGSRIDKYYNTDLKKDMDNIKADSISTVTCVADFKQNNNYIKNQDFIQGLEKFIYSMQGREYTSIFIADNLANDELMSIKQEYENIYTQISPFANMQFNFSSSTGSSIADNISSGMTKTKSNSSQNSIGSNYNTSYADTTGISETIGNSSTIGSNDTISYGKSNSQSTSNGSNYSYSHSNSKGESYGGSLGFKNIGTSASRFTNNANTTSNGTNHTESVSESISKTLSHGINKSETNSINIGKNKSKTNTFAMGISEQNSTSHSISDSFSFVNSKTLSDTFGKTQGITLNAKNMTLNLILKRIEKHLERIEECESVGMWNYAAYFLGKNSADTKTAANTYQSLMSGMDSGIERTAVNTWIKSNDKEKDNELEILKKYIKNFVHPCFLYNGVQTTSIVNPTAMISTNELALHFGLPRKSVKGLPVIEHAVFGQEVLNRKDVNNEEKLNIGHIYHLNNEINTDVILNKNSLTMHTFITGSTGSGKSNAVYHILSEIQKNNIPFLVIEPAKGEYKKVFNNDVNVFGTNPTIGNMLCINPFSFSNGIHILEHIDRLVEIFNVCWPMYAAMPAVLKDAIERAYIVSGWDLDLSINTKINSELGELFPTFDDVLYELNNVIKSSAYSEETKSDYIGSLSTRLKSLTNGINGRIFSGNEIDLDIIFNKNTIIDISRIGSMETKSLIMGIIILKLQEFRLANANEMNTNLRHITVLEEAHNLLKKTSTEQNQESSNIMGKSVEMLTNAISEIRTYGEGFIIVDQAPNLLDTAVIRNTNTKIIFRLPDSNDRKITGSSIALNDAQINELSKIPTGVAAIYQNDWQEAVLCKLPQYKLEYNISNISKKHDFSNKLDYDEILHGLLLNCYEPLKLKQLKSKIFKMNVSAKIRRDLICNIENKNLDFEWAVADFIYKCFHYDNIFNGTKDGQWNNMEDLSKIMIENIKDVFKNFSDIEMKKILYYICRTQHELYPNNKIIEKLRVEYLKKDLI